VVGVFQVEKEKRSKRREIFWKEKVNSDEGGLSFAINKQRLIWVAHAYFTKMEMGRLWAHGESGRVY